MQVFGSLELKLAISDGMNISKFSPEKEIAHIGDYIEKIHREGKFTAELFWHCRKDGHEFPTLMNALLIRDASGEPYRMWATMIDITDQVEKENALQQSEERLNVAQEIGGIGSWELDLATGKAWWSDNMYRMVGYMPEEITITFQTFLEHVLPEDRNLVTVAKDDLLLTHEPTMAEFRMVRRDGSILWIENHLSFTGQEGSIFSLKGTCIEITEKKLREEEITKLNTSLEQKVVIRTSELAEMNQSLLQEIDVRKNAELLVGQIRENYETFFNTIDDFLWVLDVEGNIVHINDTVRKRLDYGWDDLNGHSVLMVHPEERKEEAWRITSEMLAGITEYCPVPVVTRSGKIIPVETRVKRGFWNGVPVIFGVSKDVSNLQLSEQKFSTAFQANAAIMAISGFDDARYIDINHAFEESLGYTREELLGKSSLDLGIFVDPHFRQEVIELIERRIPVRKREVGLRTKTGESKTGLLSADSIFIGQTRCLLTVTMDITDRKRAEEEAIVARREAEEANAAKSEFLSRMSHELRTPMNSILGFAQLLEMSELTPVQKKGIVHILQSGRHLLELINEVLDITRIEAGRLSLAFEPVDANAIIREVVESFQPMIMEKRCKMVLDFDESAVRYIQADRHRLRQILTNLVSNAIKYNRDNGSIRIETRPGETELFKRSYLRINVTDTGIGIHQEKIQKLFMPFERIGAENTQTEGTGLGLAVVKKLTEAMAGRVGITSTEQEGSTFWIEFPLSEYRPWDEPVPRTIREPVEERGEYTGTVLYFEDNPSNVDLVKEIILTKFPEMKLIVENYGSNAVTIVLETSPDLILLDLNLPDIHGGKVMELLSENPGTSEVPVVVVTADASTKQLRNLMKAGAADYLTKPIDLELFMKVVQKFMGRPKN